MAGQALAGAVGIALFRREVSGEPSVIDSSLLAAACGRSDPTSSTPGSATTTRTPAARDRYAVWNPLMLPYRTADDRFVALMVLAPDPHWAPLCDLLGRPDLRDDPRFADMEARRANARACVEALEAAFAERPLAEWRARLADFAGEWTVVQEPAELYDDPQVVANGYVADVPMSDTVSLPMVSAPVQFDEAPSRPSRAPELGEHTESVLLDLGLDWSAIGALKRARGDHAEPGGAGISGGRRRRRPGAPRRSRDGLSGSLVSCTPNGDSASLTALTTAGGAPMAPPSPTPL